MLEIQLAEYCQLCIRITTLVFPTSLLLVFIIVRTDCILLLQQTITASLICIMTITSKEA